MPGRRCSTRTATRPTWSLACRCRRKGSRLAACLSAPRRRTGPPTRRVRRRRCPTTTARPSRVFAIPSSESFWQELQFAVWAVIHQQPKLAVSAESPKRPSFRSAEADEAHAFAPLAARHLPTGPEHARLNPCALTKALRSRQVLVSDRTRRSTAAGQLAFATAASHGASRTAQLDCLAH